MLSNWQQKPLRKSESKREGSHMENSSSIVLREVLMSDLPIFFDQQLDPEANWMAAFTRKDPSDRDAFMAHWAKILRDETTTNQTILFDGQVAGSVSSYVDEDGQREVSYWIGKAYWGKGVATRALVAFLDHIKVRPLYARAAQDNIGSLRVLEKCGFTRIGEDKGFANARGEEVEEFLLRLD
jgi:RimJ/RimL family protein N-acetyltransferase